MSIILIFILGSQPIGKVRLLVSKEANLWSTKIPKQPPKSGSNVDFTPGSSKDSSYVNILFLTQLSSTKCKCVLYSSHPSLAVGRGHTRNCSGRGYKKGNGMLLLPLSCSLSHPLWTSSYSFWQLESESVRCGREEQRGRLHLVSDTKEVNIFPKAWNQRTFQCNHHTASDWHLLALYLQLSKGQMFPSTI